MAAFILAAARAAAVAAASRWRQRAGFWTARDARRTGSMAARAFAVRTGSPWWLVLVLLLLPASAALASHIEPTLSWKAGAVPGLYWMDSRGTASLSQAQAAFASGAGRPADQEQVMPLHPDVAVWYQLQLPAVRQPTRAVFRVFFPGTDNVDMFRPAGGGEWHEMHSGDHVPVFDWPVRNIDPAFMFTIEPGEPTTYLRVRNAQPIRVQWALQDASGFMESVKGWHLALGAYIGFISMVVLLSIFNVVSWRDPIHLYYAVHVVLVCLTVVALTGMGNEYLWPHSPWWADSAPVVVPGLAFAWFGLFVRELVAERGGRLVSWLLLAHVAIALAMLAAFLIVGRAHVYRAPSVYAAPGLLLMMGIVAWYALRRPKVGLWLLAGMVALVVGSLLPLLHNLGFVRNSLLIEVGPQLGATLEIPLVLIGLYFRSRERRENRRRLEHMATTDPLTGLANHRVLLRRLAKLMRVAKQERDVGAVLRVHVANLDEISAEHGREAGEAALMRAAECVAKEAREGDLVARDPGSDILLVIDGRVARDAAAIAGRNIIARGLKYSARLPPRVTLKLRIAVAAAPLPDSDPAGLLQALARLLVAMETADQGRWLRFIDAPDLSSWHGSWPSHPRDTELPPTPTAEEVASVSSRPPRRASEHTAAE